MNSNRYGQRRVLEELLAQQQQQPPRHRPRLMSVAELADAAATTYRPPPPGPAAWAVVGEGAAAALGAHRRWWCRIQEQQQPRGVSRRLLSPQAGMVEDDDAPEFEVVFASSVDPRPEWHAFLADGGTTTASAVLGACVADLVRSLGDPRFEELVDTVLEAPVFGETVLAKGGSRRGGGWLWCSTTW